MFNNKTHNLVAFLLVIALIICIPVSAFAESMTVTEEAGNESAGQSDIVTEETGEDTDANAESSDATSFLANKDLPESYSDSLAVDTSSLDESIFDSASAVMLFDAVSGDVLYEKNPDSRVFPASTTKLMSVMIAIENGIQDRDVICTIAADDYSSDNSLMGIIRGETLPGLDLLYGMMLKSGNDAAANVAIETAGSIASFADLMNSKAAELGMTNSHFMNPSGVQDENHYTTANDMKKLAMYAFQNDLFMQLCGTADYIVEPTDLCKQERALKNTNRLITTPVSEDPTVTYEDYTYPYATGMKTGYTYTANGCLVASAEKEDGQDFIVLIFDDKSESGQNRWGMAQTLFDYAFANYTRINPSDYTEQYTVTEQVRNVSENDADDGKITFTADTRTFNEKELTVSIADAEALENGSLQITQNVTLSTILSAPLYEGQQVGTVSYYLGDRCVGTAPLVATRRVFAQGEEDAQTEAMTQQITNDIQNTDVLQTVGQDKNTLWWILIPVGIIIFIIIRARYVAKRKSRIRRAMPPSRPHRPNSPSPGRSVVYRPNQRKQQHYRNRNHF